MGQTSNSLPGQNRGAKAHGYRVRGHADATMGLKMMNTQKLSRACAKAYGEGYEQGQKDKKASVGMQATGTLLHSWGLERKRLIAQLHDNLIELRDDAARAIRTMESDCIPSVAFIQGYAANLVEVRLRLGIVDNMRGELVAAQAYDDQERKKAKVAAAVLDARS